MGVGGGGGIRTPVGIRHWVYSPAPLATRTPLHEAPIEKLRPHKGGRSMAILPIHPRCVKPLSQLSRQGLYRLRCKAIYNYDTRLPPTGQPAPGDEGAVEVRVLTANARTANLVVVLEIAVASVAQLVKAPDCGSGDHGFESRRSPQTPSDIAPRLALPTRGVCVQPLVSQPG